MAKYSTTTIFPDSNEFYRHFVEPALVGIDANGGSVVIEMDMGDGTFIAIPDSPFTADQVFRLEVALGRFRFTPSGGATYLFSVKE